MSNTKSVQIVAGGRGAMVQGKLSVPGRPLNLNRVGQVPTVLAVGAGGGCLDIFLSSFISFFSFSLSLG